MRRIVALGVVAGLAGCGVKPVEGVWTVTGGEVTENTCYTDDDTGSDTGDAEDPTFELKMNADGNSFTIAWIFVDPQSGDAIKGDPFACNLDGKKFDCADLHDRSDVYGDESAVLNFSSDFSGSFQGASSLEGDSTYEQKCDGDKCADLESLTGMSYPCSMASTMEATAG